MCWPVWHRDALPTHADMWAIGRGYTKLNTDPYPGHSSVYVTGVHGQVSTE